MKGGVNNAIEN